MNSYKNPCQRAQGQYRQDNCDMPSKNCIPEKTCVMESPCFMGKNTEWPIGMTYLPMQKWRDIYPLDEGFHRGTIFKELDLPFIGRRMC